MTTRLYLSPPHIGEEERKFVTEAFDTNWIAPLGPNVDAFEREIAQYVGVGHAAALSSGTAALHLALRLLGTSPNDEIWCSTLTFSGSANPIAYERARPVFFDSDERTWNCNPALIAEELTTAAKRGQLPKALIAVDLYGQSADWDAIVPVCMEHGVPIIEDAAEALGAHYKGRPAGSFGLCGILSFNGNKIITTSGGGMLLSDDEEFVRRARHLATQARDPAPHYQHSEIGFNYRMSNVLAGIGRGQLRVLDQRVEARRRICEHYVRRLARLPGISFMPEATFGHSGSRATRWLTCLQIDPSVFGLDREQVRLALETHNIESRPVWKPMHMQPVFRDARRVGGAVAERLFNYGLCLPSGSAMDNETVDRVCDVIESLPRKARGGTISWVEK